MSINKKLDALFAQIEKRLVEARTENDLLSIIDDVIVFKEPLKYNNTWPALLTILSGLGTVALSYGAFLENGKYMLPALICAFISLMATLFVGNFWYERTSKADNLSERILKKDVFFDNGLSSVKCYPEKLAESWKGVFCEFDRGNHSRKISKLYQGSYCGPTHKFDFQGYTLHYVNRRQETYTTTDANGNTTTSTRTVYDHYDRYGLKFDFSFSKSIMVASSTPRRTYVNKFETGSELFNNCFNCSGAEEINVAKFLTPSTILLLQEARKDFPSLNFEVSKNGEACLSIGKGCVLHVKRQYSLDEPEKFRKEISSVNVPVSLSALLTLAHKLMEQHDNNFAG